MEEILAVTVENDAHSRPLLISGADIVTMDPALRDIGGGDILIENGRIVAVGARLGAPEGAMTIDAGAMIAIPGFVDGHRHLWEGLIRNSLPNEGILDYFRIVNNGFARHYTPEDAYLGTLVSALGLIDSGITTVLDWSHVQSSPEHTDAVVQALDEAGVRAVLAFGPPGNPEATHEWPSGLLRLRRGAFASDDRLVTLALATISPEHAPYEQARAHFELAREADVMVSVHAGLAGLGEPGQIERFGREGLLGRKVNLVHCNTLSATEWDLIAASGASVSITPSSEMLMGQGTPPIQAALDRGIKPGIGVDVETSAPNDLWTQMRILLALQRNGVYAMRDAGRLMPDIMTARAALDLVTAAGAASLGLAGQTGSISPGKSADIVLLRTDMLNVMPFDDPVSAVVTNMDPRNVDTVLIAGRVRKRHGLLSGPRPEAFAARLRARRDELFRASGSPLARAAHPR